jgi:hypothetical protein
MPTSGSAETALDQACVKASRDRDPGLIFIR